VSPLSARHMVQSRKVACCTALAGLYSVERGVQGQQKCGDDFTGARSVVPRLDSISSHLHTTWMLKHIANVIKFMVSQVQR
jgi:hypothetical protein